MYCVQLHDLRAIYKNALFMLPAQRICVPPHLVITGTDHLTIYPVGYYVEWQSTPTNFKFRLVYMYTDTSFMRREELTV